MLILSNYLVVLMKKYNTFLTILIGFILINMVISPSVYVSATYNGISAWALNVLPSVLPFIFFTKILSTFGNINFLSRPFKRPCYRLYKTPPPSAYVFFMAIISGYPVGAKMTSDLYLQGKISQTDAYKMTSFCSTSGPMFIVGAVGAIMFNNVKIGYFILIAHILGAMINGLLYRNIKAKESGQAPYTNMNAKQDLSQIVIDSALSILSVGVIIAIFFVIITSFNPILSLFPSPIKEALQGTVEITKGCIEISKLTNQKLAMILASFVISFGGLSTILQSMTFLEKIKMPVGLFILQKVTHGILSAIFALLLSLFL